MSAMRAIQVACLALVAISTTMASTNLDGTYEVLSIYPGKSLPVAQDPKTPPGQIRKFIVQGSRCAMMD